MKNRFVHSILNISSKPNVRHGRSITDDDDNERSSLAGKIIDALAMQDKWKDQNLTWFAYANNNHGTVDDTSTMSIHLLLDDANKYNTHVKSADISDTLIFLAERIMNEH